MVDEELAICTTGRSGGGSSVTDDRVLFEQTQELLAPLTTQRAANLKS